MADAEALTETHGDTASRWRLLWPTRWRWRLSLVALLAMVLIASGLWFSRERIAGNIIDDALGSSGLEATYDIVSIGPQQQVIANLVVGDPQAPDLTVERVNVDLVYSFGAPDIGRVELVRPRLYGSYRDGAFSLGALDPVLFADSDGTEGLPALDIAVIDGRARIDSDYGVIGAKLDGAGWLDDGFEGILAVTAPGAGTADCSAVSATMYGDLRIADGAPTFDGPVRLRDATCAGARLNSADVTAQLALADDFASVEGDFAIAAGQFAYADNVVAALDGSADLAWRFAGEEEGTVGELSLRHDLTATGLRTPYAGIGGFRADGTLRSTANLGRTEWTAALSSERIDVDLTDLSAVASARDAADGTLLGSLLAKFESGLTRSLRGGRLAGDVTLRMNGETTSVIVPEARLRSANGETVLALSRASWASAGGPSEGRLSGNILTGGADLPRINGRMEQVAGGGFALRLTMAEYRAGGDALAIPRLEVRQNARGDFAFNGLVQAQGAIPGGSVQGLLLPVEGAWSAGSGLAIGRRCAEVRMSALTYAELRLQGRALTVCPGEGGAMVRYRDALNVSVVTDDLELSGELAGTPTTIDASRAVVRYPGAFEVTGLRAMIGAPDNAVRLTVTGLEGRFAEEIGGSFTEGTAAIDAVPLDLTDLSGTWAYEDSILRIGEGAFTLAERIDPANGPDARFEPLAARDAVLTLENNQIRASADLRHPASGSLVTSVAMFHDLTNATGSADISVPGLRFTDDFQPQDLSYLAEGVIAFADGVVTGDGQVEWTEDDISSSGTFATDDFDFAAAFGPVDSVSGKIEFTDLINLTTAPSQVLNIGAVNPGIEVLGGRVVYSMTGGEIITIEDGRWPFMGGELVLRPVTIDYGGAGGQSYIFEIIALDAASFVAQMELSNIGATGTFDGTVPIYFDAEGNGSIQGGLLISRAPGGNVSYVGELAYEDLGFMANYAFQMLRSLDYSQMSIGLEGNLAGEILTSFNFDGVRQGEGTSTNILTRQIAKLPIRFEVNVRSENFYQLATMVRSFYDTSYLGSPVDRGLLTTEGGRFIPQNSAGDVSPDPATNPEIQRDDEAPVQPPESDSLP